MEIINARDRIGAGPWQNAKGALIAKSVRLSEGLAMTVGSLDATKVGPLPLMIRAWSQHDLPSRMAAFDSLKIPDLSARFILQSQLAVSWQNASTRWRGAEHHDEGRVEIRIKRSHLAPGEFAEWIANRAGRQS